MNPLTHGLILLVMAGSFALACDATPSDNPAGTDAGMTGDGNDGGTLPPLTDTQLEQTVGCGGVYNPDQVLEYHLQTDPADIATVLSDTSYAIYVPATLRCGDEPGITVGLRRKRSGGAMKIGFKVDMNEFVAGQTYHGLKKFSLENGVSEGSNEDDAEVRAYVAEYLAWRMMHRSGALTGRAALAKIFINDEYFGVYVNVEQIDKRFLNSRLGDGSGWLYKKSGGVNDGFKTHENDGLIDPYEAYFCFWKNNGCPLPTQAELMSELPGRLDIPQMLRFAAVNALMANTDSPIFKNNNFYWYDYAGGPRVYIPWDLDTAMKSDFDVFTGGVGGQTDMYTQALFPVWEDDYDDILTELVSESLTLAVIHGELDRIEDIATEGFDSDPYVTGTAAGAVASLRTYWIERHAAVVSQVEGH